ncbi:MAG: double-strand break repair protein AddB, partial [Altererythrobacter sp.]|nr:double-strand break repair protein AddB [Altererythrobacter sp.]
KLFKLVQTLWQAELDERGEVDLATRRNMLFDKASWRWKDAPPETPIVAAGVTSAAPALARMLRRIADLPNGAVILPDLDLSMPENGWDELGRAGRSPEPDELPFSAREAATHPQYHLKLLLHRMGVAREEVRQWHRKGMSAAPPERSHAISSLFLPPEASKAWVDLPADKRRLSGVKTLACATLEDEAQAIAILVREALEQPEKRVSIVTPDRTLARRVAQHLTRWNIEADDTAGMPLSLTPAGRFVLQLAELAVEELAPIQLIAALGHPLVKQGDERADWLRALRTFERKLRGPRPAPGLESLRKVASDAGASDWWSEVETLLQPIFDLAKQGELIGLADTIDVLSATAEAMAGEAVWRNEDGRALSRLVEELRLHARDVGTKVSLEELHSALRDAMEQVSVRPPYGGHPRVAIYGLLEARMTRADLVICGGLNEGTWPQALSPDPLLAAAILRALGMPGPEFRIGLSAHDLAGALGAPEVVLTRAIRDMDGPTIPSRFLLRIEALLGENAKAHEHGDVANWVDAIDRDAGERYAYPRPEPKPSMELRNVAINVTGLDRLLGDPYQFYADKILGLRKLDPLDADPSRDFAWQGTQAHTILQRWHEAGLNGETVSIASTATAVLDEANIHPLLRGLWQPRLLAGLEWVEEQVAEQDDRQTVAVEAQGSMTFDGVRVYGRADRIDRLDDGSLAIVDYKTGKPPSAAQVEAGYALQMGTMGLIARDGDFAGYSGVTSRFEYWSLAKDDGDFGFVSTPWKDGQKRSGIEPAEFLPKHEEFLRKAITQYVKGDHPFTAKLNPDYPGYNDYDQLMRLDEWQASFVDDNEEAPA